MDGNLDQLVDTTVEIAPELTAETSTPDQIAARLAAATPGPATVDALADLEPGTLSPGGLLDAAAAWHKASAWAAGRQLDLVTAFAAGCDDPRDATLEISAALRLSARAAAELIEEAATLTGMLPRTRQALDAGTISPRHAAAVVEAVNLAGLEPQAAAAVEVKALRLAGQQNVAQLRRTLNRAVLQVDPDAAARRHADRVEQRHVRHYPTGDGMAVYAAEIEAVTAAKLAATVTEHARTLQADDKNTQGARGTGTVRTLDTARADALSDLVAAGAAALQDTGRHVPKMTVETSILITVPLAVLLGLADSPADLSGHGPITAAQARAAAYAAGATWRRLVIDDLSGTVLDLGRIRYRPGPALADTVRARHPRCLFPMCSRPAENCDLDHRTEYDRTGQGRGGATSLDNLGPLCRWHHNAKTHKGWTWTIDPATGNAVWTSPTGHAYINAPEHDQPEHDQLEHDLAA